MTAVPDVAMTLALLGTRLSSMGMMLSAAWSNLFPSNDDKCLQNNKGELNPTIPIGRLHSQCRVSEIEGATHIKLY